MADGRGVRRALAAVLAVALVPATWLVLTVAGCHDGPGICAGGFDAFNVGAYVLAAVAGGAAAAAAYDAATGAGARRLAAAFAAGAAGVALIAVVVEAGA